MSGLINTTPASKPDLSNPLLAQAEAKIETNLAPQNRAIYMKIVVAGMRLGLQGGPNSILASLQHSQDPVTDAAKGAVSLCLIMRKDAKGVMPLKAMVPAAMTLMLKALDFVDRTKMAPIGKPELDRATQIFANTMFRAMGITRQGLNNATNKVHAIMNDPDAMAKLNLKAGITRHPMAATPTPLPPS
jgi:hypothetical protein